jgi:hypothetical protein
LDRGPRIVREQIMTLMESDLPAALTAYRSAWTLKVSELPEPVKYYRHEAETLDKLPVLAMSVTRSREYNRRDLAAGGVEQMQVRYSCRLFGWVKHLEREPTEAIRDDYATVLGSVLIATPSLKGGGAFRFDETTLEASYSDVARGRGDRFIAGCSLAFDVFHLESIRRVPIGTASTIGVEATVLPGHPGL